MQDRRLALAIRLRVSRRFGTAVPGRSLAAAIELADRLPSPGGTRELARAPDSPPTGKTSELVKERLCFTPANFGVNDY
jgi:hypothetical protein